MPEEEGDERPLRCDLGDGLVMRTIRSAEDVERLAEMHRQAFEEDDLYTIVMDLLTRNPRLRWKDVLVVEDSGTGEFVSSISLVPAVWSYDGILLRVGELGVVGTRQEYRRRGLIRAQTVEFERKLQEGGYDLGVIRGIPYFYRQFGYEYAIPLGGECRLSLDQIPNLGEGEEETATIRPMEEGEIAQAVAWHNAATERLCLRAVYDEVSWRYPETLSEGNPMRLRNYIVEREGQAVGYLRLGNPSEEEKDMLPCSEMSDLGYSDILAALRFLKQQATKRGCKQIALHLHSSAPARVVARYLGGHERKPYAWQIRIPNRVRFLRRIAPALERRLAGSMLAGLTQVVPLNFHEDTIALTFRQGRLEDVASLGKTDERGIRLPPDLAVRLLLCYQSQEEIWSFRPDLSVRTPFQPLMDILFPKRESYIYAAL